MKGRFVLGVDFGGGASKATLLSGSGEVVATSIKEYPTYYPKNGWAGQWRETIRAFTVPAIRSMSG